MNEVFDHQIDTSGLICPQPLLQTKKKLSVMCAGEILQVISTDPSSVVDFLAFVHVTEHVLLNSYQEQDKYYYLIQKAAK